MCGSAATLPHTSHAEGPNHNLKASAVTLASDPVSNMSLLSQLQSALESTESGRYQLQTLITRIARVSSSSIVCHNGTSVRLDEDALHAMVANGHDNHQSSHNENAAQSRVGLAVLLLGVWANKLPVRLAYAKLPEAAKDAARSSDQVNADEVSVVPPLMKAPPAAAAAAGASTTAFSSGVPASASHSASASVSESASHDTPCSAAAVAASQPLPGSADHMSMMASDLEEEDKQQGWVPDCLAILRYCPIGQLLCCTVLCYVMLCCAMLRYAILSQSMLYCTMLCYAVPCCAMPGQAMPCHAMLCCAVLCRAMLCPAVPWHAMPCYAIMPGCAVLCFALLCFATLCYAVL